MDHQDPSPGKTPVQIYQIFYSEETRDHLDPGFIPLDNSGQRPDWREYWAIRKFLLDTPLDENTLYGFFSPKFRFKSSLDSSAVYDFIAGLTAPADIVTFSPFFDQGAFHLNTFEQAAIIHPNIWPTWESVVPLVTPGIDPHTLVMDSRHSIFCNYFAAKPAFWSVWLQKCEMIFAAAEQNTGPLYDLLNMNLHYDNGLIASAVPAKVFVIERMASLLLATNPAWRISNFNSTHLPTSDARITKFPADLIMLDSLKLSANTTGHQEYMQIYWNHRAAIVKALGE